MQINATESRVNFSVSASQFVCVDDDESNDEVAPIDTMLAQSETPNFYLSETSFGAACWWWQRKKYDRSVEIQLSMVCARTAIALVEMWSFRSRISDIQSRVAAIVEENWDIESFPPDAKLSSLCVSTKKELISAIEGCHSAKAPLLISVINTVYRRHHLPLIVCTVPPLLPKEHTHARVANGKGTETSTEILGDSTCLSMTQPFNHWYTFPSYSECAANSEFVCETDDALAQKALIGDFESYLRQVHTRQPNLWDGEALASFRVGRPATTVTFAPTRFSPCYGLRTMSFDGTSESVTSSVCEIIKKTPVPVPKAGPTKGNAIPPAQPPTQLSVTGALVRVPSIHPLHPLVSTLYQNQDESTMIVGDPSAEHTMHGGDECSGANASSTTAAVSGSEKASGGSGTASAGNTSGSVAAIISNLPPHPLRALVHGVEDFMVQTDQRHRRLSQFVDFLCKRFDGDLSLMLHSYPARHRTRLNAALFDCFDRDDEKCFEMLDAPNTWNSELKNVVMRDFAVSTAMRSATLHTTALLMSATGSGLMNEQIGRIIALSEEMLKGSYQVLAAAGKLTTIMFEKASSSSTPIGGGALPPSQSVPEDTAGSPIDGLLSDDGDNSMSSPINVEASTSAVTSTSQKVPVTVPDNLLLEHLARLLVGKMCMSLSDSSIEFGGLLRIPPQVEEGVAKHAVSHIRIVSVAQCHASNPLIQSRLRKVLLCAFPPPSMPSGDEVLLKAHFSEAIEEVVFGQLWPLLVLIPGSPPPGSKKHASHGHYLRPHQLLCLEALLVLLDTIATAESGCESQLLESFYNSFVQDRSGPSTSLGGAAQPYPLWFYPNEVIQWLCTTPSPYFRTAHRPSQQTSLSAAGLTSIGLLCETLAVRCYCSLLCDSMLVYWDGVSDEDITDDQVNATGALREFNFKIERAEHPLRSLAKRKAGTKREREVEADQPLLEMVIGNSSSDRYQEALLLTMPDTLTITQVYEGY